MRPLALTALLLAGCATPPAPSAGEQASVERAAPPPAEATPAQAAPAAHQVVVDGQPATDRPPHWGSPFRLSNSEPIQTLIDDPAPYEGRSVRVVGEVSNVCQARGCWMVLRAEGGQSMRITMKDHAFSVDKTIAGRTAHVEGTVVKVQVDPETVAHYAAEGATEDVPEQGRRTVYQLEAVAVELDRA